MLEEYTLEETKEQGRSPDSLIQAIDRIERLEKELIEVNKTLATALDKCARSEKQLIKAKNILADLTFSAPCDSILHCQIKEKAERFFKELEK